MHTRAVGCNSLDSGNVYCLGDSTGEIECQISELLPQPEQIHHHWYLWWNLYYLIEAYFQIMFSVLYYEQKIHKNAEDFALLAALLKRLSLFSVVGGWARPHTTYVVVLLPGSESLPYRWPRRIEWLVSGSDPTCDLPAMVRLTHQLARMMCGRLLRAHSHYSCSVTHNDGFD